MHGNFAVFWRSVLHNEDNIPNIGELFDFYCIVRQFFDIYIQHGTSIEKKNECFEVAIMCRMPDRIEHENHN